MLRQHAGLEPVPWQLALCRFADAVDDDWIARWFCRAFLDGRVECVAGIPEWVDTPEPSDFGPTAWSRRERLEWCGIDVAVPPLDLHLAVARRRGSTMRRRWHPRQ